MFDAILLIAGKGERTGLSYNKVLYKINNKPLFKYALETFLSLEECNKVIVVTTKEEIDQVRTEVEDLDQSRLVFTFGGKYRQDSVAFGIEKCSSEIVLIHDGARPLIEKMHILNVYHNTIEFQASVLATKTIDTIREVKNNKSTTLDREYLWNVQTPQGVSLQAYKKCIKIAKTENYYATDDVSLLEKYLNITPKIVQGSYQNIKVTTISDLDYVNYLLKEKNYEF